MLQSWTVRVAVPPARASSDQDPELLGSTPAHVAVVSRYDWDTPSWVTEPVATSMVTGDCGVTAPGHSISRPILSVYSHR